MSLCNHCHCSPCSCYTAPFTLLPCDPCTTTTTCRIKLPAKCVTINGTTLELFLNCTNLLNYLYACIVADPAQYARFCALWAACD